MDLTKKLPELGFDHNLQGQTYSPFVYKAGLHGKKLSERTLGLVTFYVDKIVWFLVPGGTKPPNYTDMGR